MGGAHVLRTPVNEISTNHTTKEHQIHKGSALYNLKILRALQTTTTDDSLWRSK